MAGVGFELKKLFKSKEGYFHQMRGFAISTAVTQGPMILNIVMLVLMRFLLEISGAGYSDQEWMLYTVTYATIFSLILSNTILMFIDRYVSDCIYNEEIDKILPSFHGLMVQLLVLGGVIAYLYLGPCPKDRSYKLISMVMFLLLLIIWSQMSYLSALKQYGKVLVGFLVSVLVSVTLGIFLIVFRGGNKLNAALISITAGYAVMMVMFYQQMLVYFPKGRMDLFGWMGSMDELKILIAIGFFMAMGLYAHNFVFWLSPVHNSLWKWGVFCSKYDVPTFYATLTITPMLVMFVVSVETKVYRHYREYFDAILHGGTLQNVRQARENLQKVIFRELIHMGTMQLFVTILCATLLGNILSKLGLDMEETTIYRILCFGYCLYGLAKCEIILMLYFEDRKGALIGGALFLLASIAFSAVTLQMDIAFWGMGYLLAAFTTSIYGAVRINYFLERLEYKVFLRQPLFIHEKHGIMARFTQRMAKYERDMKKKMKPRLKENRRKGKHDPEKEKLSV